MTAIERLTEEEAYLAAVLEDNTGIDLAEMTWLDPEQQDNCYRIWDFQWPLYTNESVHQIDQCGRSLGKCLDLDTPIPTPTGWAAMGQLQAGDTVYGSDGSPVQVLAAHDVQYGLPCYAVTFDDGHTIVADAEHLWATTSHNDKRNGRGPQVRTTRQILDTLHRPGSTEANHRIDVTGDLEGGGALPVPPYVLGVWLGDGRRLGNQVTLNDNDYAEIEIRLKADGYQLSAGRHESGCRTAGLTPVHVTNHKADSLTALLHRMGLAPAKFIPSQYLRADVADRRALLAGLMDTDGHITNQSYAEYTTIDEGLADTLSELLISLGQKPRTTQRRAVLEGKDCGPCWRVTWRPTLPPAGLMRKNDRFTPPAASAGQRRIVAVTPVPSRPVRCITVDSADRLFLAGRGMIPTHNTVGIIMRAYAFPFWNPGQEMLITAPELNHLRPVTDKVEALFTSTRLGRAMLRQQKGSGINHQPQFQVFFCNNARIISRLPNKDGKGVKTCITGDVLISTTQGLVPARDIRPGDMVLTAMRRYQPVRWVYEYPDTDLLVVSGSGHRGLPVSHRHSVLARRTANPQRTRRLAPPLWTPVDDPELGRHYWATPCEFPELELPDLPGAITDGVELLRLAGRYCADGTLSAGQISFVDDEAGIVAIEQILKSLTLKATRRSHDNAVCTVTSSVALVRWLDAHFGHLAAGKKVPAWLLGAPRAAREAFLEGYLAGDGHWSEAKARWEAGSASKALAMGLKLLAQSLGYTTAYSWVDPKVTHIAGVELKTKPQRSHRIQISDHGHPVTDDGLVWGKIRAAEPAGTATVYDLVVSDDHSYVGDGIVHLGSAFLPDGSRA